MTVDADTHGATIRRPRHRPDAAAQPRPRRLRLAQEPARPDPPLAYRPFLDALADLLAQTAIRRVLGDRGRTDSK